LRGNSQEGGEQRQKQLQMEPRDLLTLVTCRRLQFNFTYFHISVLKASSQQVTPEQRYGAMYLHYLHCSLNNILVIQSSRILWASHVARMSYKSNSYKILVRKNQGRSPLVKPTHRNKVILKYIINTKVGGARLE